MPVVFHIPGYLRQFTEGQKRVPVDVPRRVVRDALDCLSRKYPGVRDRVLTERGELRPHVNIFVATESIRYTGGLDTPIGEGEEVTIVPAVSGGSAHQKLTSIPSSAALITQRLRSGQPPTAKRSNRYGV